MKALLLNGALPGDDHLLPIQAEVVAQLERAGWQTDVRLLRDARIANCTACFNCWMRTPGECVVDDDARDVARACVQSHLVVLLTPVTFGGYSSALKKAFDRMVPIVSPLFIKVNGETHHKKRYARYPAMLGIGTLPEPDAEAERIFTTLIERNALNMHGPQHAAGVLLADADADTRRTAIAALLQEVGL